jgi:hypothetical protein
VSEHKNKSRERNCLQLLLFCVLKFQHPLLFDWFVHFGERFTSHTHRNFTRQKTAFFNDAMIIAPAPANPPVRLPAVFSRTD